MLDLMDHEEDVEHPERLNATCSGQLATFACVIVSWKKVVSVLMLYPTRADCG